MPGLSVSFSSFLTVIALGRGTGRKPGTFTYDTDSRSKSLVIKYDKALFEPKPNYPVTWLQKNNHILLFPQVWRGSGGLRTDDVLHRGDRWDESGPWWGVPWGGRTYRGRWDTLGQCGVVRHGRNKSETSGYVHGSAVVCTLQTERGRTGTCCGRDSVVKCKIMIMSFGTHTRMCSIYSAASSVRCRYNTVQSNAILHTALQWLGQNIN